jgi:hypothetical protein
MRSTGKKIVTELLFDSGKGCKFDPAAAVVGILRRVTQYTYDPEKGQTPCCRQAGYKKEPIKFKFGSG